MIGCAVLILVALACGASAYAGQTEARDVARLNNCVPKKIEVLKQTLGMDGKTTYSISCLMPKLKEEGAAGSVMADTLLIECSGSLCTPLRRMTAKK